MIVNAQDEIMSYREFEALSGGEQKKALEDYRKRFTNKDIRKKWKINDAQLYKHINALGIRKEQRKTKRREFVSTTPELRQQQEVKKDTEKKNDSIDFNQFFPIIRKEVGKQIDQQTEEGFTFTFNGEYSSNEITKKLEKLQLLIHDEESEFEIQLNIKEVPGKKDLDDEKKEDATT